MKTNTQQLPPHSADMGSVLASHASAFGQTVTRLTESFLLLAVFVAVVGPVYAVTQWFVPQGLGSTLAMYLLATMSYVAIVVGGMLLIHTEGRRANANARSRLQQRWTLVRAEVGKTVLWGWVFMAGMDAVAYVGFGLATPQLPGSVYTDDLVFYATGGAALMAWVGHIRGSVHLPQLMMLCKDRPVAALREMLVTRAKERYDTPVTFGLIVPLVVAIAASQIAPAVSVLAWLHTAWYLHVTVSKAWLAKPAGARA